MVQTSDIEWCNTKSAGIKLSHWKLSLNKFEPGEWVYAGTVLCTSSTFNLPLRALELHLSHLWTTALVASFGDGTLKEQPAFGKELKKMTVTAIFHPHYRSHRKHPLPFTQLEPIRTETRQKGFPFKQNKRMSSLNKESEVAWRCPNPNQTQPWASCPRWPCADQHGGLDDLQRPFQP